MPNTPEPDLVEVSKSPDILRFTTPHPATCTHPLADQILVGGEARCLTCAGLPTGAGPATRPLSVAAELLDS